MLSSEPVITDTQCDEVSEYHAHIDACRTITHLTFALV